MRSAPRLAAVAFCALLVACSTDTLTELIVVVDSDLEVPRALDELSIQVESSSGTTETARAVLAGPDTVYLPATLGLRPRGPGNTPVTIRVAGLVGGVRRVSAEVRTSFIEGRRLVVRIVLLSACVGVVCGDGTTCSTGGRCVSVDVDPATLPPFTGVIPGADLGPADSGVRDLGDPRDLGDSGDLGDDLDLGERTDLGPPRDLGTDAGTCGLLGSPCCPSGHCVLGGLLCSGGICEACGAPGQTCCIGAGCDGTSYCYGGDNLCWEYPTFTQEPPCSDFGVAHPAPDYLQRYTVRGRPFAQVHKWNQHISCTGAVPELAPETEVPGMPVYLGADGTLTMSFPTDTPITDCVFGILGTYESWATVDDQTTNRSVNSGYNSQCGAEISSCGSATSFCPPP